MIYHGLVCGVVSLAFHHRSACRPIKSLLSSPGPSPIPHCCSLCASSPFFYFVIYFLLCT